jgi:hypothetical protein
MLRGMIAGRAGIVGAVAYLAIGETVIPGFKLSDHMSKDQSCAVLLQGRGNLECAVANLCSLGDCNLGDADRVLRHKTPHLVRRVTLDRRGITDPNR